MTGAEIAVAVQVASAAATLVSGVSTFIAKKQEAKAFKRNARLAEQKAQLDADRRRRQARLNLGATRAAVGANGITMATVELAVGLDTFRPVMVDRLDDHVMHSEWYRVPDETVAAVMAAERVVAIGTTVVRSLESWKASGEQSGRSSLFIRRPYAWKAVDVLLTNFHLPQSTLLCLVDGFVGPRWRQLYETAVAEEYRFLSFGDAMLLER